MSKSQLSVVGIVGTDPQLTTFDSGGTKCSFRLAVTHRKRDRETGAWVDGDTSWFRVNVYRTLANNVHDSVRKGERVMVSGRVNVREWVNGERSGTSVEIDADAVGHDLLFGVSHFTKRSVSAGATESQPGSGSDAMVGWVSPEATQESAEPPSALAAA